jgi:ribonuclease J
MFVDGLAVGDISDVALRDRRRLSEDGVVIVVATLSSSNGRATATPELIARGFAEADDLLEELRSQAGSVLEELLAQGILEIKLLQQHLHDDLGQLVYDKTRRRPLILPVVVEV